MSIISVKNLTFAYPSGFDNVFEDVSFQIDTDWRLGFIGRNGRGKTTFLELLMNKHEYEGSIISSVQFDYFPYKVEEKTACAIEVLRRICPAAEDWEFVRELSYLEVEEETLRRPFESLSEGEQTKVLLAALFLNEENFLLIDEPTNHLDYKARETVAAYLRKKKGFILVSHDRRFLDGCVDHILSLNRADIEVQSGNFSSWWLNFERQQEHEAAENRRLMKDIGRLQKSARQSSVWSDRVEASKNGNGPVDKGYIGHKSAKMMKRAKGIENRRQQSLEQKSKLLKNAETVWDLKIHPLHYHSDTLVSVSEAAAVHGGNPVNRPVSFTVRRGDRIALDGRNGSGKSSILKILAGERLDYTGTISIGTRLVISYVPQNASRLEGNLSKFAKDMNIDESLLKTILRKMDFERAQFEKDMRNFSAGQKKKVLIAGSLCRPAHLYIWDEPLNFIDVYSRMQIERVIEEFSPTMIFVEHDKAFRDSVATKAVRV